MRTSIPIIGVLILLVFFQNCQNSIVANSVASNESASIETSILDSYKIVEDTAALMSPLEHHVFQRSKTSEGSFVVRFHVAQPSVERYRIKVLEKTEVLLDQILDLSKEQKSSGLVEQVFRLPAGGWYFLLVDQIDDNNLTVFRSHRNWLGIGDVFVTAGQSNSANSGEVLTHSNGMTVAFDPNLESFDVSRDPQPSLSAGVGTGGSTWPAMGDFHAALARVPVAILATGSGGTWISQWQKGAANCGLEGTLEFPPTGDAKVCENYNNLLKSVRQLHELSGGVRMILWHQGESDASTGTSGDLYRSRFIQLKTQLNTDLGFAVRWMLATTSFVPNHKMQNYEWRTDASGAAYQVPTSCTATDFNVMQAQKISQAQDQLIAEGEAERGPTSDDLRPPRYRSPVVGCIHFSQEGQYELAKRWAASLSLIKDLEM